MQQVDDPPYLTVGTEVSAKYKGAFCEAKVRKVVRNIKCKVAYKQQGLGSGVVSDDQIKGALRVGATVEVRHPERKEYVEATLTKIQDCSQYTVVFDDGDITTLRRSALCLKSGRHFNESETLDQLPLTHPEHFGNPVIGGRRGRRSRHLLPDDSSDEDDEPATHSRSAASDKEENIGKVVCVETSDNKKKNPKENWFPGLVVAPTAQDTVRIRVKDEYLVRSFKDGRYYTVPKKETTEFTRDSVNRSEATAVSAAIEYMDNDVLPPHWDREALFGMAGSCSDSDQELETDSSDDEPTEEKDHFVAQLYKFMDDRGTPLNKVPSIINRDVNLYRLFRAVQKLHGYNRVTSQNQWKQIAIRLGYQPATVSITNLVKQAYKKYLFSFEEFNRKLGCTMVPHPKTSRTKGRSLVRASLVQSPKLPEKEVKLTAKERAAAAAAASAAAAAATSTTNASSGSSSSVAADATAVDESGNTSESSTAESTTVLRPTTTSATSSKRKIGGKVKALVDRFEEKDTPRSSSSESKDRKDRDLDKPLSQLIASKTSGDSGSGGRKDDSSSTTTASSSTATGAAGSAKKEKGGPAGSKAAAGSGSGGKAVETLAEKRGRKRKDADSVDSKKDDRDSVGTASSSSSSGSTSGGSSSANPATGTSPSTKPEKVSSSAGSSGGPGGGGGDGTRLVHGSGGGGPPGGGSRTASPHSSATTPDFPIEAGDKLKVYYDEQKVTYEAKVIEIAIQEGSPIYLVHYTGWNTRYDEWVRKERIAENLTNSKQTKKGKSLSSSSSSGSSLHNNNVSGGKSGSGGPNAPATGDKTPKLGKRMRGNSNSGGGMTPRSTTPNIGRTKSPASTPSNRRPLTRGGGAGTAASASQSNSSSTTAAGRRTSNNTDISSSLSVPTDPDSDSDSDEPMMKKCTTNSSTSSTTSSNSSISISSTSTKIRSELKGFKELKSPGSPASDTTTTTTTTTTTAPGDGNVAGAATAVGGATATSTSNQSNVATEGTAPPTAGRQKGQLKANALKRGSPGRSVAKEEESTVTEEEEEDEPAKSSESEQTLSEEDSSQSSNKAFSSSPITTMVDSDTAETPLIATGTSSALSPKSQHHNATTSLLDHQQHQQDDSSSNDLPLVVRGATGASATTSATDGKGAPISVKQEPADDGTRVKCEMDAADALNAKPPMKTYGTAATIIANSEKMAFCSLRDVSAEGGAATVAATSIKSEQQDPSTEATSKDGKVSMEPPLTDSQQGAMKTAKKEAAECDDKKHLSSLPGKASPASNPQAKPAIMVVPAATVKSESTITAATASTPHSVITNTSAAIVGSGGASAKLLKVSSSASSPPKPSTTATEGSGESVSSVISKSPLLASTITGGVVSTPSAPLSMAHAAGSSSATLAALRAEKKLLNPANAALSSSTSASLLFGEKKGSLAGTGTSSGLSGTKGLAGAPMTEKKHFPSSSTLTPAQNKQLSKEALSIKSLFESSAATRMDEKISDIYEFKEAEDEFEEQDQGTTGSARKLVSDVPPAEVVSSLTLASAAGTAASTGSGLLLDDKRKKPLQRKMPHSELLTPSDSVAGGAAGTGSSFGAMKRMKKVSPIKPTDSGATVGASDALVKATKGPMGRRPEVKDDREKLASSASGASEQTTIISTDKSTPQKATTVTSISGVVQMSTVGSATTVAGVGGATAATSSSSATTTTPLRFDSTFDVLRKSPSFNLVSVPGQGAGTASAGTATVGAGTKEESSREEVDVKPTHPTPTLPGIFTPVGAGTGGTGSSGALLSSSSGLDRAGGTSTLLGSSGLGRGSSPSAAVLLAMAGNDDKQKEEPTLENCKKYFNDMNFEFDAPTVKKPPSIADKVLKALSQQQQQHSAAIKQEKPDHVTLKYMPMHHHPPLHSKQSYVVNTGMAASGGGGGAQEVTGGASLSNVVSSAATIVPVTGGVTVSHTPIKLESPHSSVATPTKPSSSGTLSTEPHHTALPASLKKESESSVDGMVKGTPGKISQQSVVGGPKQSSSLHQPPSSGGVQTQQSSTAHRLLDHMLPTARSSNDLTESIRKLDDPRFLHDDESTDSNDSEHRLIIEDAESQGSGEPPGGGSIQHPSTSSTTTSTPTVTTGLPSGTTALIVRYDHSTKHHHQTTNVIAKRELFDDKAPSAAAAAAAAAARGTAAGSSITHEMASAASAAAVAAVAEKEKIVFRQDPTISVSSGNKESSVSQSTVRTPSSTSSSGQAGGREIEKKASSSAKHNILETIIQSELNTVNRGLGSESFLKLKEQTDHQAELDRLQQQQQQQLAGAGSCTTSSEPSSTSATSTIVTTRTSNQDPLVMDEKSSQQQQQQQQQANNESLSLLLCEETIPGSPAPKDQDRLPPVNTGRKVYAETPLGVSSTFLAPPLQNMQTAATDLKPVPMDLEPPVVTITIAGNTTISSTSQAGAAQAAAAAAAAAAAPNPVQFSSSSQGQSVRTGGVPSAGTVNSGGGGPGKGSGGGESAVDTPNSSPRDSVSQDETHDPEASVSPLKKRRQRKPSEDPPSHKRHRRTAPSNFGSGAGGGGYSSANNGSSSGYGRSQRGGMTTANASDSEDNSDSLAAFHRSASSVVLGKSGRTGQYNFLVNLDPSLNNNQRIAILKKKIQELRKTYNAIKAELASIDRRRKKLRRRERENKKQAKLNSANAANN